MSAYKIKKECYLLRSCLVDAGRTLLFMLEQVFLLMGSFGGCLMQIHDAQGGERGGQRAEKNFLCLNFSCLAIKYEFYFTLVNNHDHLFLIKYCIADTFTYFVICQRPLAHRLWQEPKCYYQFMENPETDDILS